MDATTDNLKTGLLDDYFTEPGLAEQLNKSVRALQRMRELQIGPPVTFVGKTPYYAKDSVREWLLSLQERPRKRARRMASRATGPPTATTR